MNNKIIIVAGDPNSINSEIIYKTWKKIDNKIKKKLYLIANYNLICKQYRKLKYKTNIIKINNIEDNIISSNLKSNSCIIVKKTDVTNSIIYNFTFPGIPCTATDNIITPTIVITMVNKKYIDKDALVAKDTLINKILTSPPEITFSLTNLPFQFFLNT